MKHSPWLQSQSCPWGRSRGWFIGVWTVKALAMVEAHTQPVWGRRRAVDQLNSISGTSLFFTLCALSISLLLCKSDNTSSGKLIDTAFPVTDFGLHYRVMDLAVAKYWQYNEVLEVIHQGCCWAWYLVGGSKQQGREALCHLGPP